jgi:hypothetical protein
VSQTISPTGVFAGSFGIGRPRGASQGPWASSPDSRSCSEAAITFRSQKTRTSGRRRASGALQKIAAVCLTVAGVALITSALPKPALQAAGSSELERLGSAPVAIASPERASQGTLPIEDVKLGDRVKGCNPLREQAERFEPDADTWRAVALSMQTDDGRQMLIELLRPVEWLEENDAHEGRSLMLAIPEMGAVGAAVVTRIGPCPAITSGVGAVVTGKFAHESDGSNVVSMRLDGQAEPMRVTRSHPYWSVDRREFVEAGALRDGELLDTESGLRRVESVSPCGYTGILYNLETTEHVYRAGALGALVHNGCGLLGPYNITKGHHILMQAGFKNSMSRALAISEKNLGKLGITHAAITAGQRRAVERMVRAGTVNSLNTQARIARRALVRAGMDPPTARAMVAEAVQEATTKGFMLKTNMPWHP